MIAMHLPRGAVEQKMRADGVDVAVLNMDPNGPPPKSEDSGKGEDSGRTLALKDDPKYKKY